MMTGRWLLVILTSLMVASCTTHSGAPPRADGGAVTAVLLTSGPRVYVNGRPARSGMPITSGDEVSTGGNSSALIRWSEGTTLQVDQNSDPLVVWEGGILYVNCGYGWFLFDTGQMLVRVQNELGEVIVRSRVAVSIVPDRNFDAFLLEGRLDVLRPPGRPLAPNEKVLIGPQGILAYAPIPPAERLAIEQRFARWEFAATSGGAPSWLGPALAIALGGLMNNQGRPDDPDVPAEGGPDVIQAEPQFPIRFSPIPDATIQNAPESNTQELR